MNNNNFSNPWGSGSKDYVRWMQDGVNKWDNSKKNTPNIKIETCEFSFSDGRGGFIVSLSCKPNSNNSSVNFIQTIETNRISKIGDNQEPEQVENVQYDWYFDPLYTSGDNSPHFYYSDKNGDTAKVKNGFFFFEDEPHRDSEKNNTVYWKAKLSIVEIDKKGTRVIIQSFSYSFQLNPDNSYFYKKVIKIPTPSIHTEHLDEM